MFGMLALVVATVIVRHELHATILWLPALFSMRRSGKGRVPETQNTRAAFVV